MATATTRHQALSDEQWERIEPLLPSNEGRKGHPFRDNRRIVEGIICRYRTGIPWRDLPRDQFGPWQTVWKRHYLYARLGVWDRVHAALISGEPVGSGVRAWWRLQTGEAVGAVGGFPTLQGPQSDTGLARQAREDLVLDMESEDLPPRLGFHHAPTARRSRGCAPRARGSGRTWSDRC